MSPNQENELTKFLANLKKKNPKNIILTNTMSTGFPYYLNLKVRRTPAFYGSLQPLLSLPV